jgi:hypothetical protein
MRRVIATSDASSQLLLIAATRAMAWMVAVDGVPKRRRPMVVAEEVVDGVQMSLLRVAAAGDGLA